MASRINGITDTQLLGVLGRNAPLSEKEIQCNFDKLAPITRQCIAVKMQDLVQARLKLLIGECNKSIEAFGTDVQGNQVALLADPAQEVIKYSASCFRENMQWVVWNFDQVSVSCNSLIEFVNRGCYFPRIPSAVRNKFPLTYQLTLSKNMEETKKTGKLCFTLTEREKNEALSSAVFSEDDVVAQYSKDLESHHFSY